MLVGEMTKSKNPRYKSSWKYFYETTIFNQFRGLVEIMSTTATDLEAKHKSSLDKTFHEWEGYDYFDNDVNRAGGALTGVGAALIIGADDLIKKVKTYNNGKPRLKPNDTDRRRTSWEDAIIAAGNYVRHGDEWHKRYIAFIMKNKNPAIFPDQRKQLTDRFLSSLKKTGNGNTAVNLQALENHGIVLNTFLMASSNWHLAKLLNLNDIEFSLQKMVEFLNSHHNGTSDDDAQWFPTQIQAVRQKKSLTNLSCKQKGDKKK